MKGVFRRSFNGLALWGAAAFVLHGCASTKPMALTNETKAIETKMESIALMTLKMSNQYVPSYQPGVSWIQFNPSGNSSGLKYAPQEPFRYVKNEFCEYLISVQLAPGRYTVGDVMGMSGLGLQWTVALGGARGSFQFPVNAEFELKPDAIVYIGHVDMVNRKRRDDSEPRSGSVFPLAPQGVTGFAGGTFDVSVSDRYDEDMKAFREKYPVIANQPVAKALLVKVGVITAPTQVEAGKNSLPK
jgi:hypothetical protein